MQISGEKVVVLLPNYYNAKLLKSLQNCIVEAGGQIIIIGFNRGEPLTDSTRKEVVKVDMATDDVSYNDYSALVILDSSTPEEMKASRRNLGLIVRAQENGKIIATVDRGVELLVAALGPLMKGKSVTGPTESRIDLEGAGSVFVDQDVVADGGMVTARSVESIERFCHVLLEQISKAGGLAA